MHGPRLAMIAVAGILLVMLGAVGTYVGLKALEQPQTTEHAAAAGRLRSTVNVTRVVEDELAGTENRIAVERKRYNDSVRNYNILVKRFPGRFFAGIFGFSESDEYFEVEESAKEVPVVKF